MRLAILTDIHANRAAFAAVLADLAQRGVDRIALLGDIVGYGPDPAWCVQKARQLQAGGAIVLRGNHDDALLRPDPAMSALARAAIDWTRPHLGADDIAWLAGLPLTETLGDLCLVHASPQDPAAWVYVTSDLRAVGAFKAAPQRVIFCGHVHRPQLYSRDLSGTVRGADIPFGQPLPLIRSRRWLGVIGAVGQPRDGQTAASYAIHDAAKGDLTFHRAPYDVAATVAGLRAAGLPEALATRLMNGT